MASRIVVMRHGVIQQVGTPVEVYAEPTNTFVATFVGSPPMNLFEGHLSNANGSFVFNGQMTVPLDGRWNGLPAAAEATLGAVHPRERNQAAPVPTGHARSGDLGQAGDGGEQRGAAAQVAGTD